MAKIWLFGNSFSGIDGRPRNYLTWYEEVSRLLNTPLTNFSHHGASFQYILNLWCDLVNLIRPGDKVIVVLPDPKMTYFFKDNPEMSMPWFIEKVHYNSIWHALSKKQQHAFLEYYEHLHSDQDIENQIRSFLNWLDASARDRDIQILSMKSLSNLDTITDGFSNLILSTGRTLMQISREENPPEHWEQVKSDPQYYDERINHLNKENHLMIGLKVAEAFSSGELVL